MIPSNEWELKDGVLTIRGEGALRETPWSENVARIQKVIIAAVGDSNCLFTRYHKLPYPMLCDFCVQTPEITAFYHMVGNFNVLLRFAVPDVKTLDALVGKIKTFGDSRTSIEL